MYSGEGFDPPTETGMQPAPRDYNTDWYYVWNNSGSIPWVQVSAQYTFLTRTSNKIGPYGSSGSQSCGSNLGDVVQLYDANQGGWFHEGIISYIPYPCGGLSNYYVDAHTTNYYHLSLSSWSIYTMRFMFISGWKGN